MSDVSLKSTKRPRDINQLAFYIVSSTLNGDSKSDLTPQKEQKFSLLGKKGGKARAEKLTAEQRSKISQIAAQARWKPKLR